MKILLQRMAQKAPRMTPLSGFLAGMVCFAILNAVVTEDGLIRKAHAITVNVAVRMLNQSIEASEARIIEEIGKVCSAEENEG